jgi:Escherichia/Staphylococcus phage prohead protease
MAKRDASEIRRAMEIRRTLDLTARWPVAHIPFTLRDARPIRRKVGETTIDVLRVEGHASVFNHPYDVYGGPARYGWIEEIDPAAFDVTLSEDPDVVFLLNHDGMTMARTKSGTLKLEADKVGLYQRADLDLRNPDSVRLASGIERGDIDEMSFAFWVKEQVWSEHPDWEGDEMSHRLITRLDLHRGDVSAVNFGASDSTDIDLIRSAQALDEQGLTEALADASGKRQEAAGSLAGSPRDGASWDVLDLLRIK